MEQLGIDGKQLFAQLFNFALFTFVFFKFMYKPFAAYIATEKEKETQKHTLLAELQKKETTLETKQKEIISEAREQARVIIHEAEVTAEQKKKDMMSKVQEEITAMKMKAQQDISEERNSLYDEVRKHVVKTSETLTTSVLKNFIDEKKQKDMLEHVFAQLKKSKVYEN